MISLLLALPLASAQTQCVEPHSGPILKVDPSDPSAFPTIQDAVSAATDGDVIDVAPGTFQESVDLMGRSVTIRGQQCSQTTVFGVNAPATFYNFGSHVTIHDLAIEGEDTFKGAHILNAKVRFENVCAQNLGSETAGTFTIGAGAAIEARNTNLCTLSSVFRTNTAKQGGAISVVNGPENYVNLISSDLDANHGVNGGALHVSGGTVTIDKSSFNGNTAMAAGAGAFVWDASLVTVWASDINANVAQGGGGGFWVHDSPVSIDGTTFDSNQAQGHGGAVYLRHHGSLDVMQSLLSNNSAVSGGGIYWDARLAAREAVVVRDSVFQANQATSAGAGLFVGRATSLTVERSEFLDNVVSGSVSEHGGGIYSLQVHDASVTETFFCGNKAKHGGAHFNHSPTGPTAFTKNLFLGNSATVRGGALWLGHGEDLRLDSNTFTASSSGWGASVNVAQVSAGATLEADLNLFAFESASGSAAIDADAAAAVQMSAGWGNNACHDNSLTDFSATFSPAPSCHAGSQEPFAKPTSFSCASVDPNDYAAGGDYSGYGVDPSLLLNP